MPSKSKRDEVADDQIHELLAALAMERALVNTQTTTYDALVALDTQIQHCHVALGSRRARRGWSSMESRALVTDLITKRRTALSKP